MGVYDEKINKCLKLVKIPSLEDWDLWNHIKYDDRRSPDHKLEIIDMNLKTNSDLLDWAKQEIKELKMMRGLVSDELTREMCIARYAYAVNSIEVIKQSNKRLHNKKSLVIWLDSSESKSNGN